VLRTKAGRCVHSASLGREPEKAFSGASTRRATHHHPNDGRTTRLARIAPYDGAMRMFRLNFRVAGAMRLNQSAAAVAAGFCFIISSIPFFISFAEGSALWVPTIQL